MKVSIIKQIYCVPHGWSFLNFKILKLSTRIAIYEFSRFRENREKLNHSILSIDIYSIKGYDMLPSLVLWQGNHWSGKVREVKENQGNQKLSGKVREFKWKLKIVREIFFKLIWVDLICFPWANILILISVIYLCMNNKSRLLYALLVEKSWND